MFVPSGESNNFLNSIGWRNINSAQHICTWWRHQMETFSAQLAICAGNSPVPGKFTAHRSVTRSFDVCLDLRLNKRLNKQSWGWWFETLSRPLWRHCNDFGHYCYKRHVNFKCSKVYKYIIMVHITWHGRHGPTNYQQQQCLLRLVSKKTSNHRTAVCLWGESTSFHLIYLNKDQ